MITSAHRFHGYGSLNATYRRGKTVRSQWFALRYAPNNRRHGYRAAVVVSRKVHKSAVVRNRIRRRLYALIHEEVPSTAPPIDCIFTVFSDRLADAPSEDLRQSLRQLLIAAGLR